MNHKRHKSAVKCYRQIAHKSPEVFLRALFAWVPAIKKLEGGFGALKLREVVTSEP